jgi:archaellin
MKTYKKTIIASVIALGVIVLNLTISINPNKGSNALSLSQLKIASSGAQAECSYVLYSNNGQCIPGGIGGYCVTYSGLHPSCVVGE